MGALLTESLQRIERHLQGRVALYINPDYRGEVDREALLSLPSNVAHLPGRSSRLPGKVTWWVWQPPWHKGPGLAVRRYAHGGALGRLSGTLFLGPGRMQAEFAVAAYAHRHKVPTSAPVALHIDRVWGPLVKAWYISELVPDASNMLDFLNDSQVEEGLGAPQRRRLAKAIAAAIADMHEAGILHADLNLRNLLVRDPLGEPQAFIIDFDKARLVESLSLKQRMRNVLRLDRSVAKWAASRRRTSAMDRLRVLRAYLDRCPRWRAEWSRIARQYGSRSRTGWRHYLSREPD